MDSSKIKALIIVVLALFFALYLGVAAATAQLAAAAWIGGGVFLTICLFLGKNIWILIPATLGMRGAFNFLPGTPAPWHLMTLVVGAFFLIRLAMRTQYLHFKWTWIETGILLIALTILQAFVRNPVGFSVLGGDVAGGKPYLVWFLAFAAYFLIIMSPTTFRTWRWAVILYIVCAIGDGIVTALSAFSPAFAGFIIPIYSNVSLDAASGMMEAEFAERDRISELAQLGGILGLIACTFWRPIAALDITKPWQFLVAASAGILILLSGFRGALARFAINFVVGSALRRKPLDILIVGFLGSLALIFIIAGGLATSLPYGAQRALSFLPIEVDASVEMAARGSSETRFEMWALALKTDRYIHNKFLGDGFNISARELKAREDWRMGDSRMRQQMTWMEQAMEMGSYHGFHVETIRFTGVVGLIAATIFLIAVAIRAFKTSALFRNTPYYGYVLFICMPFIIHPLWYWFVFGSYRSELPLILAMTGMVKLLQKIATHESQNHQAILPPAVQQSTRAAG